MRRIGLIAFPNFQVLSLSTLSVFECANISPQSLPQRNLLHKEIPNDAICRPPGHNRRYQLATGYALPDGGS
jgi:hypothetical protein